VINFTRCGGGAITNKLVPLTVTNARDTQNLLYRLHQCVTIAIGNKQEYCNVELKLSLEYRILETYRN